MSNEGESYALKAAIAGSCCAFVASLLNPLDVTRIRLQNQSTFSHSVAYRGMMQGVMKIWRDEGIRGVSQGLTPSIMRELFYSTIRLGAYEPIKSLFPADVRDSPITKLECGLITGGVGAAMANPLDLVKTRFQSILPGQVCPYGSTFKAFSVIYRESGLSGLYKGWQVTCIRAAILNAAQIGSYDVIKNNLLIDVFHMQNGIQLHFCASMIAGIITTTAANPVDVIKTRYLSDLQLRYKNPLQCVLHTFQSDGAAGFLKGWVPNYWRLGTHTVFTLMLIERVRAAVGLRPI